MAQSKEEKKKILEELKEKFSQQKIILILDFTGLKVKEFFGLRKDLKKIDSQLKVAKKTLIQLALKDKKLDMDIKKMNGEIALVFGFGDENQTLKTVWRFSQKNKKLKILGGILENEFVNKEKVIELAQLPSREELLAGLVRTISSPISSFVNVLEGNIKGLLYILSKINT